MRALLLLFIIVPLVELLVLIRVGSAIGGLSTVALVVLTAVIGLALIRIQGVQTLMSAQQKMALGETPARELLDGIGLAIAGVFLLLPGFVTDTIGFALLIPGLRQTLFFNLIQPSLMRANSQRPNREEKGRTIDGESWRE
ncbi:FxsA family protein [Agaribacterium sp. ZY112]|uniref:FxsA family protein n=1 Tax=Agaribacterium sp. ZY112 TaxID=3233574 RepID=UPI003525A5B7